MSFGALTSNVSDSLSLSVGNTVETGPVKAGGDLRDDFIQRSSP